MGTSFKSSAFRDGLRRGFSAMFELTAPRSRRHVIVDDPVAIAWREVGKLMDGGLARERRRIEETTPSRKEPTRKGAIKGRERAAARAD